MRVAVFHSRLFERQQRRDDQHRVLSGPVFAVCKADAHDEVEHQLELERQLDVRRDAAMRGFSDDSFLTAEVLDERRHELDKLRLDVVVFENFRQTADQELVTDEQRV